MLAIFEKCRIHLVRTLNRRWTPVPEIPIPPHQPPQVAVPAPQQTIKTQIETAIMYPHPRRSDNYAPQPPHYRKIMNLMAWAMAMKVPIEIPAAVLAALEMNCVACAWFVVMWPVVFTMVWPAVKHARHFSREPYKEILSIPAQHQMSVKLIKDDEKHVRHADFKSVC